MRKRLAVATIMAATIALTGCSSGTSSNSSGQIVEGGEIHVAWNAQPTTLDPIATTGYTTRDIDNNVFEGLVALDADSTPQPMLAESWNVSDDYKTFTFTMRQGVKFQNGDTMETSDVVDSINRWISDSSVGKRFQGSTVTATDDHTVQIVTPTTMANAIDLLARPTQPLVIMPSESIATKQGSTGVTDLIGTGPYKISEWKQDQYIKLEKFDDYSSLTTPSSGLAGAKTPHVDTIYFDIVTDASTRVSGVQTGQYDAAVEIPSDSVGQVESDPNISVVTASTIFDGLVFNKKEGVFQSQDLRKAVQTALDHEAILTASRGSSEFFTLNGALNTAEQTAWYTDAGTENYNKHDVEAAKQLVQDSGYNGEEITFLTTQDYPFMYSAAVVITQELQEIGLNVDMQVVDWATVLAAQSDPSKFDMFLTYFSSGTPSTYAFLGDSWAGWTDSPEISAALDQLSTAGDDDAKKAAYAALQEAYFDYVPIVKLGDAASISLTRSSIGGYSTLVGPILYNVYRTE